MQQTKEVGKLAPKSKRACNFNPGPAALPLSVLKQAQEELIDYKGTGISILEMSHRSKEFEAVLNDANALLHEVFGVPDIYKILWLGGGASTQFYMIPANIMLPSKGADYINTGTWSKKAIKEAKFYGQVNVVATSEDKNYCYIPKNFKFNEALGKAEAPRGELVYYVASDGSNIPYSVRIRTPSFRNNALLPKLLRGHTLADAPIIIGSIDPCYSCTDRIFTITDSGAKKNSNVATSSQFTWSQ